MPERLYSEHPHLYDAIQSDWDYDRDIAFVQAALDEHRVEADSLLEVGCGTGKHTRRFVEEGFEVTGVEPSQAMRATARENCSATIRAGSLPELSLGDQFDVVVALRGVLNHLPPDDLGPAIASLDDHRTEDGLLVFDNSPLPPDGNTAAIDIGTTDRGEYARITQMTPMDDGRLSWDSIVFTPDGDWFVDSKPMTPFDDLAIATALSELGLAVTTHDGFGPEDPRTVFVATTPE